LKRNTNSLRYCAALELNTLRHRRGDAPVVGYQALCRELSLAGPGCASELSSTGARSILRRYSDGWFSANAARRGGDALARYPRCRRSLMPSRYYAGTFVLEGRHLNLPTARGCPPLALRLSRPVPYDQATVRSLTLLNVGPKLFVDLTAEVPVASYEEGMGPNPAKVAGVDLGIIHPYALVAPGAALLVSGRAIRAEHRLHLAEKKARARALARCAPTRGQAGSRRWRKYRAQSRRLEERHRRRVVGDPRGLLANDAGKRQNLAVRNWRPRQMIVALADKAALAGIDVARGAGPRWPNPRAGRFIVEPAPWWRTAIWWEPPTSPREDLGAGTPLTSAGWRSCTVEPVGICPAGPGVIHDASRWTSAVEKDWILGRLWPAPRQSGSRSVGSLRRPERGTVNLCPKEGKWLAVTALYGSSSNI
jgi:hypothetical protein